MGYNIYKKEKEGDCYLRRTQRSFIQSQGKQRRCSTDVLGPSVNLPVDFICRLARSVLCAQFSK